ncbi:MAG TPA: DUF3465 domain-containing protein [Candidatus Tyrphobacter sp.]
MPTIGKRRSATVAAAALLALNACTPGPDDAAVCAAFHADASAVEVVADGSITRLLGTYAGRSDAHEGFLLHLRSGCDLTVRVESNVTLTGPIPLHAGERAVVKGEYEYDVFGGVIHWTHRETHGRHPGGYVEAGGRYYW